jgi:hypothetical protein
VRSHDSIDFLDFEVGLPCRNIGAIRWNTSVFPFALTCIAPHAEDERDSVMRTRCFLPPNPSRSLMLTLWLSFCVLSVVKCWKWRVEASYPLIR